jgi:hypothetical protein
LAKSVIEAVSIYLMMTTMIPNFIMQAVQRLQRDFTWGDTINGRKYHDVRWELISTPKDLDGPRLR